MDAQPQWLQRIDQTTLTPLVRKSLTNDEVEVTSWTVQPILGSGGLIANLYRYSGSAQVQGELRPWSLILKACPLAAGDEDPAGTYYWKREALAYQSGFLERLEGEFVAPRCYAVEEPDGAEVWIWLEEVYDLYGGRWSFEQYEVVARHLGAFNGRYLMQQPADGWFSRQWLRKWTARVAPVIENFDEVLQHPLARRYFPPQIAQAYKQLWPRREELLTALDHLPQTFCHRDAHRRNLFARRDQHGREQTIAVDWADAGIGALGEELVPFVFSDIIFFQLDITELTRLEKIAFRSYLAGLHASGWQGHERLPRLGFTAAAFLRYGLGLLAFWPMILDEEQGGVWEGVFGHPHQEIADRLVQVQYFLLQLADEALQLSDKE